MGAPAGFENTLLRGAWSRDDGGKRVAVGGADRTVCIWDVESSKVLYKVCVTQPFLFLLIITENVRVITYLRSYPDIRAQSLRSIFTRRSLSVSFFPTVLHVGCEELIYRVQS